MDRTEQGSLSHETNKNHHDVHVHVHQNFPQHIFEKFNDDFGKMINVKRIFKNQNDIIKKGIDNLNSIPIPGKDIKIVKKIERRNFFRKFAKNKRANGGNSNVKNDGQRENNLYMILSELINRDNNNVTKRKTHTTSYRIQKRQVTKSLGSSPEEKIKVQKLLGRGGVGSSKNKTEKEMIPLKTLPNEFPSVKKKSKRSVLYGHSTDLPKTKLKFQFQFQFPQKKEETKMINTHESLCLDEIQNPCTSLCSQTNSNFQSTNHTTNNNQSPHFFNPASIIKKKIISLHEKKRKENFSFSTTPNPNQTFSSLQNQVKHKFQVLSSKSIRLSEKLQTDILGFHQRGKNISSSAEMKKENFTIENRLPDITQRPNILKEIKDLHKEINQNGVFVTLQFKNEQRKIFISNNQRNIFSLSKRIEKINETIAISNQKNLIKDFGMKFSKDEVFGFHDKEKKEKRIPNTKDIHQEFLKAFNQSVRLKKSAYERYRVKSDFELIPLTKI